MLLKIPTSAERTRSVQAFLATDRFAARVSQILASGADPVAVALHLAEMMAAKEDERLHEMFSHALVRYAQEKIALQ